MRWRGLAGRRTLSGVVGLVPARVTGAVGLLVLLGLAGLTACAAPTAPGVEGSCTVHVDSARDGATLAVQPLVAVRRFDLTYLHSVTKTLVRETLAIDAEGFVQQRIEFLMPGPGLPTEALPGEVFERRPDRFVYDQMRRRIGPELLMRVDPHRP